MQRILLGVLGLLALAAPASAHFPWIVPSADGTKAQVVFSDTLEPDKNVSITKLQALTLNAWVPAGKKIKGIPLNLVKKEHAYEVMPEGFPILGGICKYGVVAKGKGDPFLLIYYPKAIAEAKPGPIPVGSGLKLDGLQAFDIIPKATRGAGKPHVCGFTVFFQQQPLAGAEVVVMVPGSSQEIEGKTDKDGYFDCQIDHNKFPGHYGIRARHVEKKAGKEGDKEYKEIRHYATLVFRVAADQGQVKEGKQTKLTPHPEATKLLADGRAARALWKNFPGFSANLVVNIDGVLHKGRVVVDDTGKVNVTLADKEVHKWATGHLRSVVSHRLDGGSAARNTPCAFEDDNVHNPLGRKIRVLNDELHSSYRVRDGQIVEVNRQMATSRFTITVLESVVNAEKKFLSSCYVVNTWDTKTNALLSSQAFHQTWVRVGQFDLPRSETIINAGAGTLGARTITLANHKLQP